jgi:hypothetical protein
MSKDLLKDLPTELLIIIFAYLKTDLPELTKVCSWTNTVVKSLWASEDSFNFSSYPLSRPTSFIRIFRFLPKLTAIRLDCTYLSCSDISLLPLSLLSLKLEGVDHIITNVNFFTTLAQFQCLNTLRLSALNDSSLLIDFRDINQFFSLVKLQFLQLHRLYLKEKRSRLEIMGYPIGEMLIFPDTLIGLKILNCCNCSLPASLQELHIRRFSNDSRFFGLNSTTITSIISSCPQLSALTIIDQSNDVNLTDLALKQLGRKYPNLAKLKLSRLGKTPIVYISDFGIMFLANICKHLRCLQLDSFPKLTDAGLIEIITNSPTLRNVSLSYTYITDDSLNALISLDLKKLSLKNCRRISSTLPGTYGTRKFREVKFNQRKRSC